MASLSVHKSGEGPSLLFRRVSGISGTSRRCRFELFREIVPAALFRGGSDGAWHRLKSSGRGCAVAPGGMPGTDSAVPENEPRARGVAVAVVPASRDFWRGIGPSGAWHEKVGKLDFGSWIG